jgi:uncharacterized membrane protein
MSTLEVALFFHILSAISFIAGAVVAGVAFEAARRRDRPADIALLLGVARAGVPLVGIGALAVLGFGLWLVHLEHLRLGVGWIQGALGLWIAAVVLGGYGGRRPRQARELATELAAADREQTPELRALLDDVPSRVANYVSGLALLAILALMVFKPGA